MSAAACLANSKAKRDTIYLHNGVKSIRVKIDKASEYVKLGYIYKGMIRPNKPIHYNLY